MDKAVELKDDVRDEGETKVEFRDDEAGVGVRHEVKRSKDEADVEFNDEVRDDEVGTRVRDGAKNRVDEAVELKDGVRDDVEIGGEIRDEVKMKIKEYMMEEQDGVSVRDGMRGTMIARHSQVYGADDGKKNNAMGLENVKNAGKVSMVENKGESLGDHIGLVEETEDQPRGNQSDCKRSKIGGGW